MRDDLRNIIDQVNLTAVRRLFVLCSALVRLNRVSEIVCAAWSLICYGFVMKIIKISNCVDYVAEDRAVAKEFMSPKVSGLKNLSIAEIRIPPGVTVKKHYHLESEETYHITEGFGIMHLDGVEAPMNPGDAIAILPGQWHTIHNPNMTDLVMIVTCSPPWKFEDQVFAEES